MKEKVQHGSLTSYLYWYSMICTLIFILMIFDIIPYKVSNDIYKRFSGKEYIDIIQDVEFAITESQPSDDQITKKSFLTIWSANAHLNVKNGEF